MMIPCEILNVGMENFINGGESDQKHEKVVDWDARRGRNENICRKLRWGTQNS